MKMCRSMWELNLYFIIKNSSAKNTVCFVKVTQFPNIHPVVTHFSFFQVPGGGGAPYSMLWRWQCNPEPNSYPKPHITHPSLQSPPAQSTAVIAAKMKTNSTWVSLQETLFHAHTSLEMIQLRPISVLVWGWLFCFVRKTRPFRQNDQLHQKWRLLC